MLEKVVVGARSLASYRGVAPAGILDELEHVARDLRGLRVLHLNATPFGGGVSEILRSHVPLLLDLGIAAHWRVITGGPEFFDVTKLIHNGLQGAPRSLTALEKEVYVAYARRHAALLDHREYDVVFVHDPQPAAILHFHGRGHAKWIWRCHLDTSSPNSDTWAFVRPFLADYDAAVFTLDAFVPADLPVSRVELMPPAIDPLSPKNMDLPLSLARQLVGWHGVRVDRPLVLQVSRFDVWKDPLGVIEACRMLRDDVAGLQLVLIGSMALDDPEGSDVHSLVREALRADPHVRLFRSLTGVSDVEVNAFQRVARVVVQKSIREGFGLSVAEALWKGTPVVGGRTGGIPLQLADGVGGLLVDSVAECSQAIRTLLEDEPRARALGAAGRERVRQQFLSPRLVLDELRLLRDLVRGNAAGPVVASAAATPASPDRCVR